MGQMSGTKLQQLQKEVIRCTKCPRLIAWCEQVATQKVKRFAGEDYWGKPLPSFGDPNARLLLVGLAPAAHGGTRTGRMFTGDRSGDWLFEALYDFQFANQPEASSRNDGLTLRDCYITATLRCAPPQNKPTAEEMRNCSDYLHQEFMLLKGVRVIVALGKIGFDAALKALRATGENDPKSRPKFGHGHEFQMNSRLTLIASYHPSQQNTFTGKLTKPMFHQIFQRVRELLD